ncbi:hypothetical protein Tco_0138594 [Tanacetum coccineum]
MLCLAALSGLSLPILGAAVSNTFLSLISLYKTTSTSTFFAGFLDFLMITFVLILFGGYCVGECIVVSGIIVTVVSTNGGLWIGGLSKEREHPPVIELQI